MVRRAWLGLLPVLALLASRAAAQDEFTVPVAERNIVLDMRSGKKPVNDDKKAENLRAIDVAARSMLRITLEVNRGLKAGTKTEMTDIYKDAVNYVLDLNPPFKKLTAESQKDYILAFGKAAVTHLRTVFVAPDKPFKYEFMVRVNAARLLALVARSGYEECADLALEVIENPKESDGVKFYALQALKNLFGAINPDDASRSTIAKPERELKAVKALIAYVSRKPPVTADTLSNEVEAVRYVRREAVRALGNVRKPIYRNGKTVEAAPAVWLLKVAAADPALTLPPSVSERAEGLIGYLQLQPDRQANYDYAAYFVAKVARDLAAEYNARQQLPPIEKKPPQAGVAVSQRDYYGWKLAGARLETAVKDWRAAWEVENPRATPAQTRLMTDVVDQVTKYASTPMQATRAEAARTDASPGDIDNWLNKETEAKTFVSQSLFADDPTATVTLPPQ